MVNLERIAAKRKELLASYPNLVKELTDIRTKVVKKMPELLKQAEVTLKEKGCQVFLAKTGTDVNRVIIELLQGENQIVRSYSNTLKEIGLDEFLQSKNITVYKTNINEIISEMLGKKHIGHPIMPNFELTKDEIIAGIKKYVKSTDSLSIDILNKQIQRIIKEKIIQCEFGFTGINSIAAENGTLILAEDEGNGRAVSNLPYRHVVIAGLEKLTYSVEEGMTTIQGGTIYGLARNNPTYYSLISGPSRTADIEFRMAYGMHGPKEVHVILLDNGRLDLIKKGCGDVLKCIDCGACYNSMRKIADANKWSDISLTPKGMALGIIQGKITKPQKINGEHFECPVGININDLEKTLCNLTNS